MVPVSRRAVIIKQKRFLNTDSDANVAFSTYAQIVEGRIRDAHARNVFRQLFDHLRIGLRAVMQVCDDIARQHFLVTAYVHVPGFYSHVIVVDEFEQKASFRADLVNSDGSVAPLDLRRCN